MRTLDGEYSTRFDAPAIEGYVIGRSDENSDFTPDIDLTILNAQGKGVSRRHAALVRYQGAMHVLDLQSINGTYINNKRLQANIPYLLHGGDNIRFGTLELLVVQL
jgi:pSer/pThr/pTyr-binding forkhead associated (FHA) protein